MNIDAIIEQIVDDIKNLPSSSINKTTELAALNVANSILFPLKESKQIKDFQFSANIIGEILNIGIFITENEQDEPICWDLSIKP